MKSFPLWKFAKKRPGPSRKPFNLDVEHLEERTLLSTGASNLVAAYNFNEGSGTILHDSSGNGHNGTITNAAWSTAGKYGDALSFDGTNALVNIPDAASLHLTTGMTLEAWVDPATAPDGWLDVVYKGNDNYYLEASSTSGGVPAAGGIVNSSHLEAYGSAVLPTNTWSFLAATYDGTTMRLYVNGELVASQAGSGSLQTSTNPLQIGGDSIYGQYFQGLIDNVRIYNTALSQAQIQADMNTPITSGTSLPTAPASLTAAASGTTIKLSWKPSSDTVGVTYLIQRENPGSTSFVQIGTTTGTSYTDSGLTAGSTYRYRVRAKDLAGKLSSYSNTATATTAAIASGLVAAYNFDAGSGTVLTDVSGNGNNGTIVNATWTTAGKYGDALSFNGDNALVNIPDAASLHLTTGMTLEAWVDPATAPNAWQDVIYKGNDNFYLSASSTSGGVPAVGGIVNSSHLEAYGPAVLPTNTWSFLAATYDGTTMRLYVNGQLVASQAGSGGSLVTSTNQLQIGGDSFYGQYFQGLIDNVRIYNTALSQAQVQADMNTPVGSASSTLTLSPSSLPSANVNSAYSATLTATGGSGAYTFQVTSGSLPPGLSLNGTTGVLSGSPMVSGSSSFTVTATDSKTSGLTGSRVYTLTVNPASSLTLNPSTLAGANVNTAYSATLSASGGSGTYTFAVTSGSLPAGLALNASTGVLSGTPTAAGTTSFTITATDSNTSGLTGSQAYTLTVNPASSLTVNPSSLPGAAVNSAYSATLTATGGSGTYTFAVTSGSLPAGLALNASTGVLSGTPTVSGSSTFTITATDSQTSGLTGSQAYTLTVSPASSLTVNPSSLPGAAVNSAYSATLTATGGSGTYTFAVTSGSLPEGLALNASTGVLSGTPAATGTSSFTITATDSSTSGLTGSQAYTLTVNPARTTQTFPNNVNVPPLAAPSGTIINVSTVSQLESAVANLQSGQTIVIAPGTYNLTAGLYIGLNSQVTNVAIRGATNNPKDVMLLGAGMDNSSIGMGISVWNAQNVIIANLSIGDVYYDDIELKGDQGADRITIYNDYLFDSGEQIIKGDPNTTGGGVTNSVVEYCTIGYTNGPSTVDHGGGTGYTNGVDIHGGSNWTVSNNYFYNFHTPDSSANLWNPVVLFWNHSANNTVNANTFINCDRAIAFGLDELTSGYDNQGGSIENNFIYMAPGEYSAARIAGADAPIIAWDSPGTTIDQNTVLVNGNMPNSIQVRFVETTGVLIRNNLSDAPLRSRDNATYTASGNYFSATPSMFVNPSVGDLHLVSNSATQANVIGKATLLSNVPTDYDGQTRTNPTDIGADQYVDPPGGNSTPGSSLTVTPSTLPSATANSAYRAIISATGGSGSYSFAVTSGSLPSWLSLNAGTGVLSGTPTSTGTSSFTISVTDTATSSLTASQAYTLTVNAAGSLTVSPASLAAATVNNAFSATISATGGSGAYTFAVSSGSLPSGLSLNASTGVLSGTPATSGSYSFTITATDGSTSGLTGSQAYALTVNPASSLTINPSSLPGGSINTAYSATVSATGGSGTYTFAVTAGSLPSGLTLNASTGVLSGTPGASGSFSFTITATDSKTSGLTGSRAFTLTVNGVSVLTVGPVTLPSATANSAYSATVTASGGSGSYTFAATSGMPSWLTLNASTGLLSGTPATTGTWSFTISASDNKTSGLTGSQPYTLIVNAASSLTVTPASLPSATAGSAYSATVSATGGSGSYTFAVTAGSLPSGLSLNASTGALTGTPSAAGSFSFTVTATDSKTSGLTGSQVYTLVVSSVSTAPPAPVPPVTSATITTPYLTIPNFGANPTIYSVASGNWSNPATWSLGRVPTTGDIVDINPGTTVTYDVNSTAALNTLEIQPTATLTFATNINTQVVVGNFLVLQGGTLIVGTAANPIAANVVANIDLGNQPLNASTDPQQFGDGLIVLGNVTMHGMVQTPYVTLAQEVHAGDTVLHLATPVTNWQPGNDLFLPDTRQLPYLYESYTYQPEWERVGIQSVSADGLTVYLTAPVKYDHLGARDVNGVLDYLPQVMNDSRNIMVGSASMTGIRGYTLFTNRANVDIEYAGFCELGRTTNNAPSSTNIADRYAMTMLDLIGPTTPQANGYQFTLIGNEVDNDGDGNAANPSNIQWGIALNKSFYGLIQYNVVSAVAGAGMGVEDGASSFNVFDHNFVANVIGTAVRNDQALQGDGFWFGNPNNYITNNIATDINGASLGIFSYGFDVDATKAGTVAIPAFQGADPSVAGQSTQVNMNDTPLLQFSGNELYGATPSGMTLWWIGTFGDTPYADARVSVVKDFIAWNFSSRGFYGYPTNNVTIDGMIVRGDVSQLNNANNGILGITFDDYMAQHLVIQNCDIQGMGTGIKAPYFMGFGSTTQTVTIQNCFLDNRTNIDIIPPHSDDGTNLDPETFNIVSDTFAHPSMASWWDVSMDYGGTGGAEMNIPQYVYVTNYNGVQGDDFQVFYTQTPSPTGAAPANAVTNPLIDGLIVLN